MIVLRLFIIALPVSFAWEMLQMPAFAGLPDSTLAAAGVCAIAGAADALIVLALGRLGAWIFGDPLWFAPAALGRYTVIVIAGVAAHSALEWLAVTRLAFWTYRNVQPTLPDCVSASCPCSSHWFCFRSRSGSSAGGSRSHR